MPPHSDVIDSAACREGSQLTWMLKPGRNLVLATWGDESWQQQCYDDSGSASLWENIPNSDAKCFACSLHPYPGLRAPSQHTQGHPSDLILHRRSRRRTGCATALRQLPTLNINENGDKLAATWLFHVLFHETKNLHPGNGLQIIWIFYCYLFIYFKYGSVLTNMVEMSELFVTSWRVDFKNGLSCSYLQSLVHQKFRCEFVIFVKTAASTDILPNSHSISQRP